MGEAHEYLDFLEFPDSSPVDQERLDDVETILKCIQGLTDHIAYLEHEHIVENMIHKKQKIVDLESIRYQKWLSAAFQKLAAVGRELKWDHQDWSCTVESTHLPTDSKCILDDSLNDGLAIPLEPVCVWMDTKNERLPSPVVTPHVHDIHVFTETFQTVEINDSETQISNNEMQKKVDHLRAKLKMKEAESYKCPVTYDSRAVSVLSNLESLEGNMTEFKELFKLLEKDIEMLKTNDGQIKNKCYKYVTKLEALKKKSDVALIRQKILNKHLQTVTQSKSLENNVVEETSVITPDLQSGVQKDELFKRGFYLVEPGRKRRNKDGPGRNRDRESIPKNMFFNTFKP